MIDAVHPWQAAAAIGAIQTNEADDANDAGVKPTGCGAQKEANVPFVVLVEGRWAEQPVACDSSHRMPFNSVKPNQWVCALTL